MVAHAQLKEEFGFAKLIGVKANNLKEISAAIRKGFPFQAIGNLQKIAGIGKTDMLAVLRMPSATYARRKAAGKLSQDESERLLRMARFFRLCLTPYGGEVNAARLLLQTPQAEFQGETFLDQLKKDDESARRAELLLDAMLRGDWVA